MKLPLPYNQYQGVELTLMTIEESQILHHITRHQVFGRRSTEWVSAVEAMEWCQEYLRQILIKNEIFLTGEEIHRFNHQWKSSAKYQPLAPSAAGQISRQGGEPVPWMGIHPTLICLNPALFIKTVLDEQDRADLRALKEQLWLAVLHERRHLHQSKALRISELRIRQRSLASCRPFAKVHVHRYRNQLAEWDAFIHSILCRHDMQEDPVLTDNELKWLRKPRLFPQGVVYAYQDNLLLVEDAQYAIAETQPVVDSVFRTRRRWNTDPNPRRNWKDYSERD